MKKFLLVSLYVVLIVGLRAQTVQILSSSGAQPDAKSKVSAMVSGTVGAAVDVGFCWTVDHSLPVYSDDVEKTSLSLDSTGTLVFDGEYELSKDTVYLIRAFAIIDSSLVYSDTMSIWLGVTVEAPILSVSDTLLSFAATDLAKDVLVTASHEWDFTNTADWLIVYKDSFSTDGLKIVPTANLETSLRTATVKITSDGLYKFIYVYQSASEIDTVAKAILELSDSVLVYPEAGGEHTLVVASTNDWTYNKHAEWITVERDTSNNLIITAVANPDSARKSYITITSGDLTKYVLINQDAKEISDTTILELSEDVLEVKDLAGIYPIKVTANKKWLASTTDNWLKISDTTTYGFHIVFTQNLDSSLRKGVITLVCGAATKTIVIYQAPYVAPIDSVQMYVSEDVLYVDGRAHTKYVGVASTKAWSFDNTTNWFSVSTDTTKPGLLAIAITANTDSVQRKAFFTITSGSARKNLYIVQSAKIKDSIIPIDTTSKDVLIVSDGISKFETEASSELFAIIASQAWTFSSSATWLTARLDSISPNALRITATENTDSASRQGTITITSGSKTKTILIVQAGKSGVFTKQKLEFTVITKHPVVYGEALTDSLFMVNTNVRGYLRLGEYNKRPKAGNLTITCTYIPEDTTLFNRESKQITIVVAKRVLKVKVANQKIKVKETLPQSTIMFSGFAYGEVDSVIDVKPHTKNSITSSFNSGIYDIIAEGGSDLNYTFEYEFGKLSILAPIDSLVFTDSTKFEIFESNLVKIKIENTLPAKVKEVSVSINRDVVVIKFDRHLKQADLDSLPFYLSYESTFKAGSIATIKNIAIDPADDTKLICTLTEAIPANTTLSMLATGEGLTFGSAATDSDDNSLGISKVYPTLVSSSITIQSSALFSKIVVVRLSGEAVLLHHFGATNNVEIDLSSLIRGTYFVNYYDGDKKIASEKIIKQ